MLLTRIHIKVVLMILALEVYKYSKKLLILHRLYAFKITLNAYCLSSDNGLSGGFSPHYFCKFI